jgi:hypothetical protein
MQVSSPGIGKGVTIAFAALLAAAAFVAAGCSAINAVTGLVTPTTVSSTPVAVPMTITDTPGDQVIAASLTLNSIVLTDATGKTASILSAPMTFEATHLDAVQEPLFTPAIPQDTFTSVTLAYSNAQVAYLDPATRRVVLTSATLANNGQTITFATPIVVNSTTTSLLVDFLVANSVSISGTTVTVTPAFHIAAVPIPPQPTNGTNGLQCGYKGKVTALGTNSFTLTNPSGNSLVIKVNANTQYQGLSGFSALAVGALVEVDTITQSDGSLLAARVEVQVLPNAVSHLLVGPVTAVTGSPATSFTEMVHQNIGGSATSSPVEIDTITVTGTTAFLLPGRLANLTVGSAPFTPSFSAATIFAGQSVTVATSGVTNNAATAVGVALNPQTVGGVLIGGAMPACIPCWGSVIVQLPSGHWLATLTGQTTVTVYINSGNLQAINSATPVIGGTVRFHGFLFKNNGALVMLALAEADGPGTPIAPPHP